MSELMSQMSAALRSRHYSRRTEQAYCLWVRRFIRFHGIRHPADMAEPEINAFLTHLAVEGQVSASTQTQALSALLFLYRRVIGREVGELTDLVRARKARRLPVVLTRDEVKAVLAQLDGDTRLMASLMYGAGLRLMECLRLRVLDLEFTRVDDDVKSLLVTSSVQGEGKSVCVANLAVTLAMGGKKVFIVDADLRRPRQHQYFGLENAVGVSTVVTGQTSLDDALRKVHLEPVTGANEVDFKTWAGGGESLSRIYVLTSGPLPPNPGEIVSSRRFAAVIETLAEEADIVLVDSPAMLAVGDTAALASLVDGLVFLVDMQRAKRPMLQQAADQLVRLPCRSLGIVLRVEGAKSGGGYYSSYRYYEYADGSGKRRGRRSKGAASARADVSRRAPG